MFIRPLTRFIARIPPVSADRLLVFNKCHDLPVGRTVISASAQLHTDQETTKKPINREIIYVKTFEHNDRVQKTEIIFSPEKGYEIFIGCGGYIFLTLDQAKFALGKIAEAAEASNMPNVFKDKAVDLRICKTEKGYIRIKRLKPYMDGIVILPECVHLVKKNLIAVLKKYEELKAEGKLRSQ